MSRAILLIGSPKPGKSASRTFAEAVGAGLEARGHTTRIERVTSSLGDQVRLGELLVAIAESDLVLLAFPVYWDSLPAPVLHLLEAWAAAVADGSMPNAPRRLAVLTQCGFPEASHCQVAIDVCRLFAEKNDVAWSGALAFGMGGAIAGGSLAQSPLRPRLNAFNAAVEALAAGEPLPTASVESFARPLVPAWTYPLLGGFAWSRQARQRSCTEPLTLKRYTA
jgi:NAD(P)H-dependent FMN reductase